MTIEKYEDSWVVDDRYQIYKSDGCIYDTLKAEDIPEEVFLLRDALMAK